MRELPELVRGAVRTGRAPARLRPGQRNTWQELTTLHHLSAPWRALPDFLVIGVQRAGTSSLFRNLIRHPQVISCIRKEVHYFDAHFEHGEYWYRGHFPLARRLRRRERTLGRRVVTGEATPIYLVDPQSQQRMLDLLPNARFVVLLRDPVARAYSQYRLLVRRYDQDQVFEALLEKDPVLTSPDPVALMRREEPLFQTFQKGTMIARGLYVYQLERLFERVPRERVLVLGFESMARDEAAGYERVTRFLGLEPFVPDSFARIQPPEPGDPLAPETRARLETFFAPHNERLFALLGERMPWGEGR